ncbi:hypothetical protein [cyanobacterium endosymbiont of Rhopalodia gibberula]|uniref:hypothetical protein n=1 Tax=cyanobacterium endosymbiont of Rhopalodia gibberula TaxID=1763363 RepID=UPI000E65E6CB|nr:hypothetical protein [cyanobacterium endosymbiont of Rhopalodia gibberula]
MKFFLIIKTLDTRKTTISSTNNLQLLKTYPSVNSWIKRSIDIVGSIVVGRGVLGALLILILITIQFDNPGAVF